MKLKKKIKIIHFITSLGLGGAEKVLFNLCVEKQKNFDHHIICLKSSSVFEKQLKKFNIKVLNLSLEKNFFKGTISCVRYLLQLKKNNSLIVQTWLPHSDLYGGIISKICGIKNIIWNIRISKFTGVSFKSFTILILFLNSFFSHFIPKKIVSCSYSGAKYHSKFGYKKIFTIIPNGFKRRKIKKRSFKISNKFTIGIFSRYHKVKNHVYLFQALNILKRKKYNFNLILLGPDINKKNSTLVRDLKKNEIFDETIFINKKNIINIDTFFSFLDLYVLCSKSEGFPNILGEAIINGVPSITTDVGDAKLMVGNKFNVIPKNNIFIFSKKLQYYADLFNKKKTTKKSVIANSIKFYKKYSHKKMINRYQDLWNRIA